MAFWSGDKLLEEVERRGIVDPYDPKKIDCSAYTLTMGPEFFVSPDYSVSARDNVKKCLASPSKEKLGGNWQFIVGGELIVPPGQFALLLTQEFVRIPPDAMGFISLKFGVKGPGLINVSGFHVDPGYAGRLIFSVYNAGPTSAHLNRGQDVFLLWLADLDRESGEKFVKPPNQEPTVSIPPEMITRADRPMHSLKSLSDRIEQVSTQLTIIKTVAGILATAAALAFAAWGLSPSSEPASSPAIPTVVQPTRQLIHQPPARQLPPPPQPRDNAN